MSTNCSWGYKYTLQKKSPFSWPRRLFSSSWVSFVRWGPSFSSCWIFSKVWWGFWLACLAFVSKDSVCRFPQLSAGVGRPASSVARCVESWWQQPSVRSHTWLTVALGRCLLISFPTFLFSDSKLVAWDQLQRECLYHRNQQMILISPHY